MRDIEGSKSFTNKGRGLLNVWVVIGLVIFFAAKVYGLDTELTVDVLADSTRILYQGEPIKIHFAVAGKPSSNKFEGVLQAEVVNYWNEQINVYEQAVDLTTESEQEVIIELVVSEVGYYEVNLKLISKGSTVLDQKKIWSVAVLDYPRNFPADSPFGTYIIGNLTILADIVPKGFYKNMAQMGAKWGTFDIWWKELEPEKGRYDWTFYDSWLTEVLNAGMIPVPFLYAVPDWNSSYKSGNPGHVWTYPPIDWNHWDRFVYDFVRRYKDWMVYLRIWNEPNVDEYWRGSATDYAKLVQIASQAAKRAKPDIKIIIEAVSIEWPNIRYDAISFFDEMHQNTPGYFSSWDIAAIHNYYLNNRDYPERTEFLPTYDKFINWRNKNKPDAEVWDTEFGCMAETWLGWLGVGEKHQAQWLGRSFVMGLSKGLSKMIWFPGYSWPIPNEEPYYNPAGLLRVNLTPRPAYVAYHTMASALSWAKYEKTLALSGDKHGVIFKTPEGYVTALWSVDAENIGQVKLQFKPQQTKISVVDIMGRTNKRNLGKQGDITLDITEDIIYIYSITAPTAVIF